MSSLPADTVPSDPDTSYEQAGPLYHDQSNPRITQLLLWFTDSGGWLHPDVRVAQDQQSGGFHVVATKDIDFDDYQLVVKSHIRSTLSYLNLDHGQNLVPHVDSPLTRCIGKIPAHILTYLLLIEQRMLGDDSPWSHYIACLPSEDTMATPPFFSAQDCEYFRGTPVYSSLSAQRSVLQSEWESALASLKEAGLANEQLYATCDLKSYLWAVTIITSRAFISQPTFPSLPKFSVLFPVIDLLDHSPTAKAAWDFAVHDSFSLKLSQPFKAGQELLNNYGPKHNGELLFGYGFAIPDNPVEQIHLKIRFSDAAQEDLARLCEPNVLPFNLDPQHCKSPFDSDVLIRPKGSPLGRYQNRVPCLSACPSQYVLSNYLLALRERGLQPESVPDPSFPGLRITLATLKPFYAFLRRRCTELPITQTITTQPPQNSKQKYAFIYRTSQAKLSHSLLAELNTLLSHTRSTSSPYTGLLTTTTALSVLKTTHPTHYSNLKTGLRAGWPDFDVDEDIPALAATGEEYLIWTILLLVFHILGRSNSVIDSWLRDLESSFPLSSSTDHDEEDEEASFISQILASAAALEDETWTAVADLGDAKQDALIRWALRVVRAEMMELPDLEMSECERQCLYLRGPDGEVDEEEEWVLRDVEVGDWRDVVVRGWE